MKETNMVLNHETAMRLWVKSFGKQTKAVDFAGREIAKGAYNDRNSQYGWNVDHILPQSKGGTTADHNLVCCNILTNDEKADRFPCFNANGHRFEIIKVQRHYEIRAIDDKKDTPAENASCTNANPEDIVNFYDSASGLRLFKKLKGIQNKKPFVGYVLVRLQNLRNTAVVDFLEEIFEDENILFSSKNDNYYGFMPNNDVDIHATNYDMPLQEDIQNLLNKCILLNTYLGSYFLQSGYIGSYNIYYAAKFYENKMDMYKDKNIFGTLYNPLKNTLYINDLVIQNTEAKNKITIHDGFIEYGYVYTELSKNLKKEVNGK